MNLVQAAATVAAVAAGVAGVAYLGRVLWRLSSAAHDLVELIRGRPARWPGDTDARPGLAEYLASIDTRLATVECELQPNGGRSVADRLARIAHVTGADRT